MMSPAAQTWRRRDAPVITPPPPYVPPVYPASSACWCCGQVVTGYTGVSKRACPACGVEWMVPADDPGSAKPSWPPTDVKGRELLQRGSLFHCAPKADYADQFDVIIDHAINYVPSPA